MVDLIPKPTRKSPKWQNILMSISLVLLIVAVAGYFLLDYLKKDSQAALQGIEESIAAITTPEDQDLEKEVFDYQKKIEDFAVLFGKHLNPSSFFALLEESCHPQVWFTELDLDFEKLQATVSGKTPNFYILGQQSLVFQKQDLIKGVGLSKASIGKGGEVDFTFSLSLDPEIFK
ncbi:MAG: hypothetical protein ABH800_00990 [Candidatus Nealsonbacteria bacterium]